MPITSDGMSDFSGGVRTVGSRRKLRPNEVSSLSNFRVDDTGGLVERWGSQRIHTSAFASMPLAGYEWRPGNNNADMLLVQVGTHIHWTLSEQIGYPASFTDTGATISATPAGFAGFLDAGGNSVVYIGDGGPLNRFNGAAVTSDVAGTPDVSQLVVYNRRLFGFALDTLYWSDLDNGDSLGIVAQGGGFARIRTFGGGDIVGLGVLGNSLFIFHANGVSRFQGWSQDDIDIDSGTAAVDNPVGALDWRSIVSYAGYLYWVAPDTGVYRLSEGGSVEPISQGVTLSFNGTALGVANTSEREIWFHGTGSAVNVFNVDLKAWSSFSYSGEAFNSFVPLEERGGDRESTVFGLGSSNFFVYDLRYPDAPLDFVLANGTGGSAITAIVHTRPFYFKNPARVKSLRFGYIGTDNITGNLTVSVADDNAVPGTPLAVTPDTSVTRFQSGGRYKAPSLRVTYTGSSTFGSITDLWLDGFVLNRPR